MSKNHLDIKRKYINKVNNKIDVLNNCLLLLININEQSGGLGNDMLTDVTTTMKFLDNLNKLSETINTQVAIIDQMNKKIKNAEADIQKYYHADSYTDFDKLNMSIFNGLYIDPIKSFNACAFDVGVTEDTLDTFLMKFFFKEIKYLNSEEHRDGTKKTKHRQITDSHLATRLINAICTIGKETFWLDDYDQMLAFIEKHIKPKHHAKFIYKNLRALPDLFKKKINAYIYTRIFDNNNITIEDFDDFKCSVTLDNDSKYVNIVETFNTQVFSQLIKQVIEKNREWYNETLKIGTMLS